MLAVSALLLWIPVLGAVTLNPDESQYEATASYLVATETSAFLPNGAPAVFGLFKLMTWLVGPYPIFAMRVLVMAIAFASALVLFGMVRRVADRWSGLVAGLVFLHYAPRLEGFVVNREWFASFATLAGLALYTSSRETTPRRPLWLIVSGFLCGMALWFKLQASFIVFVIPAVLLLDAIATRSIGMLRRDLPWFAAGGIGSGLAYLAPFWFQGTLEQFLGFMLADVDVFVAGNEAAIRAAAGDSGETFLDHFLLGLPYRPLFLIAYVAAALVAVGWIQRIGRTSRNPTWVTRRGVTLFAVYLFLAMICVQLGSRFFAHYYQLMLPAVAALVGLAFHFFSTVAREHRGWRVVALVVVALLAVERLVALLPDPVWTGELSWPRGPLVILFSLGALGILAFALQQPLRRAAIAMACWIVLQSGMVVLSEQLATRPTTMAHSQYDFAALTQYFEREKQPGDRLFVWGWAPEIYSLTRLEAASHITFCQYVAGDLKGVPNRPALDEEWADLLMAELGASKPRFIVDASRVSWFETERWIYELRNFPDFELNTMLERDYREVARVDDCPIWERVR
ncbi:MAG: hypothetical protein GTN89_04760 [Acidobacteria bacterium]|nr:hypothetical protein [Acidobacteriota bacterium]NIM60665.1 hypothetical protein [Acidobacteriota bacterium]NIO58625.1 hypothetical protein [Acidobacteriota bacterium]NIQ29681.1 hypothetical protein [Acidobacteriota bacterium]NIQ84398.1 hypothetical protein [Acidobacteriota bacterium]